MLKRRTLRYALGMLALAALGCRSHPELSKTNEKGSSEWRRWGGQSQMVIFTIAAGNRIDTPEGEKVSVFGLTCNGYSPSFEVTLENSTEVENDDVNVGFDDATLAKKKWEPKTKDLKNRRLYYMEVPESELPGFVHQLRQSGTFQFEFTPKGGKPQRSKFKLLNINTLLDQEQNCKEPLARLH